MWQPESVLVVVDRVGRSCWLRRGGRQRISTQSIASIEPLERRALLAAEITVFAPSNVNVTDGQSVDLNPLIGPLVQFPGRVAQASFTIRNDGDTPLSLGPAVVTGDFGVISTPAANVAAGQTTTMILGLNLSTAGSRTGTISLPTNDGDENPFDLVVSADVIPSGPSISVVSDAGTQIVDGVTTVNFGSIPQGQTGPTRTFTLTNRGSTNLSIGRVTVPTGFIVTKGLGQGLAPGAQDTLTVQLDSGAVGTFAGAITIENNDPTQNPFDIPVTGTVTAATPAAITVSTGGTNLVSGTTTVNFGAAQLGQPGPTRTFLVQNTGGSNLSLGTVSVPAGYKITDGLNALLTPGQSDTFTVQLDTSVAGTRSGTIVIPSNASNRAAFAIPVTGTVSATPVTTGPAIVVQSGSTQLVNGSTTVDFGTVPQGVAGPTRTFTVTNQGNDVLTLGSVTVPTGYTVTEPLVTSLDPGASDTFTVTLDTATAGTKSGSISIANNDPAQNPFVIPVTGVVSTVATGPEIAVRSGSTDLVSGTTVVDFGAVPQGVTGPLRTFTVTNQGTTTLTLGAVTVPSGFTVTKSLATSLAPGGTDTLIVQMDTSAVGAKTGAITIVNNDPNENPFVIPVTGTVGAAVPELSVRIGSQELTDGSGLVNFGTVGQGQTGPTRTFVVTNQGGAPLTLGAVQVPPGYTLTEGLNTALAPGASDAFTVRLDSTTLGTKSGTIEFTNNDPNENPFDIPVTGTVSSGTVTPGPEVVVLAGGRSLNDGVSAVSFGTAAQGSEGPARTFTVMNAGTSALTLGNVSVPGGFTLIDPLASSLAPGESDTFTVRMNTATVGTRSGVVRFSNNDTNENPFDIPVTGTVTGPVVIDRPHVAVSVGGTAVLDGATRVDFGSVTRGQPGATQTFTVANNGTARLTLGSVAVPAGYALIEGLDPALAPGASDTFTVRLNSVALGTKAGQVRFATNDPAAGTFNIPVTGQVVSTPVPSPGPVPGTSPEIVIRLGGRNVADSATTVRFGSVRRGRVGPTRTFRVTNTGTDTLTLGKVAVPPGYKLVERLKSSLAPGQSDTFTVRLRSASVGMKGGAITIATNDADENPFVIAVTGRVVAHKAKAKGLLAQLFSRRLIEDAG